MADEQTPQARIAPIIGPSTVSEAQYPPPETATSPADARRSPQACKRWARRGMWLARGVLALVLLIGASLSLTPYGRAATRAGLLFEPLIATDQPATLSVAGEPIRHTSLTLSTPYDTVYLDVYAPTTPAPPVPHAREGIIIIPGVGDNRQAEQLINLSESLARSGVVAVDMTTDILINFTISTVDSEALVRTYQWLARQPGVDARRIGFLGLSGG
ncbi:MAG TPA: hypothetical protein VKQ36_16895, partial [Ktedonobacterales bacterium]|nr:hypothetical protein [Ktedonobacterales bacterium]